MKYADIITLQDAEYFLPVFDLANEHTGYWKQFIPTLQFYDLLERALESVGSTQPGKRKSLWVQGTFGTGKSHASSVIRHLLCDDWADVSEYVTTRIRKPEMAAKLEALRKGKRLFPVVLNGVQCVHSTRTFELVLERTVKEALRGVRGAKQIAVDSDFERAISEIEKNPLLKLEEILPHKPKLRAIAKTKNDVLKKLKACDIELYLELEEALADYSIHLTSGSLTKWLSEVEKDIREKGIADGLIIFWDEFTSVMDTISSGLTNMVQTIAALSVQQNVYLHLISHRHSTAYGERGDDVRKMNDRFHIIQYRMEANTTYHLMAATLKVKNQVKYEQLFGERGATFDKLINYLTDNESQDAEKDIRRLFPLHPYTAALCSAISSHIGSANRSVFGFMYAEHGGFLDFIDKTGAEEGGTLLTADYLWDFFRESFENDANKYGIVTETYNSHIRSVAANGATYEKVFKGVLLLNALRHTYDNEKVAPSQSNILRLFEGEPWAAEVAAILNWFNQNQIIQKDPLDNYIIEYSSLPIKELNEEKLRQGASFCHGGKPDAVKVLSYEHAIQASVARLLGSDALIHKSELVWLSCAYDETFVKSRLKQGFRSGSSLHVALFLAVTEQEQFAVANLVRSLAQKDDYKEVLFVVLGSALDNDGMQWERLISYFATQQVAQRHNLPDQSAANKKKASQLLENWALRIKSGNASLYFRVTKHETTHVQLAKYINEHVGHQIFAAGAEAIEGLRTVPMTFWKEQISKKAAEIMISKQTRDAVEAEFKGQWLPAKQLLRDDNGDPVVDERMQLKKDAADLRHPLAQIQQKVDELIKKAREKRPGGFNLGTELQPLTEAPFGLYGTFPNMALLGFALRKYLGEFNNADVGTTVSPEELRDKVEDIFKFWRKENGTPDSSLNVRFGTKAERDLKDMLVRLFELTKVPGVPELTSIKNVRWGIIEFCNKKPKKPLWSLKHAGLSEAAARGIAGIAELVEREETPQGTVETLLATLKDSEYDILELVRKDDAYESGFASFVKKIEDVQLKDEWLAELNEFLAGAMQGAVGLWKEQDVKDKVKSFYIKKIAPHATPPPPNPQPEQRPPSVEEPPPQERIATVRAKIKSADNMDKMRTTLELILEKFPAAADVIESNLE